MAAIVLAVLGPIWAQEVDPEVEVSAPVDPAQLAEEQLPSLPEWSEEDQRLLDEGTLVPGADLLSETLGDLELPPPPPLPDPPPEIITPGTGEQPPAILDGVVGQEFVDEYFGQRPFNYLLDPQELLSRQESADRSSFLQYHAGDSEIDLYVYLFDARQELPEGVTIEQVFEQNFGTGVPSVLVFYYLGMPERSEMALSREIKEVVSLDEQQRALRNAIQEAFEKSDPTYQLDNFTVELSIRLYWFEKALVGHDADPETAGALEVPAVLPDEGLEPIVEGWRPVLINVAWGVGFLVVVAGLGFAGRWIAERRIRYEFPEIESSPLLGAPHAAGVGAVVSFGSAQLPPAKQRDQVPDYLQRM